MTLSVMVVDGHIDTVDSCNWDGHDGAVRFLFIAGVPMVILTLSAQKSTPVVVPVSTGLSL
jgi:hypothetical protein